MIQACVAYMRLPTTHVCALYFGVLSKITPLIVIRVMGALSPHNTQLLIGLFITEEPFTLYCNENSHHSAPLVPHVGLGPSRGPYFHKSNGPSGLSLCSFGGSRALRALPPKPPSYIKLFIAWCERFIRWKSSFSWAAPPWPCALGAHYLIIGGKI